MIKKIIRKKETIPHKEIPELCVKKLIEHRIFIERDSVTEAVTKNKKSPLDNYGTETRWWKAETLYKDRSIYANELGEIEIDFGKGSETFAKQVLSALKECGITENELIIEN